MADQNVFKNISFVGVRTSHLQEMRRFLLAVGYELTHEEGEFLAFNGPGRSRFELFGLNDTDHEYFRTGPVVGFEVENISTAMAFLRTLGIEFLSDVCGESGGTRWAHFTGPDGNIYEIVQH